MPHFEIRPKLRSDIQIVREMMLTVHYFQEERWLGCALSSPDLCRSEAGQRGLTAAAAIARQFGFAEVADWISAVLESLK